MFETQNHVLLTEKAAWQSEKQSIEIQLEYMTQQYRNGQKELNRIQGTLELEAEKCRELTKQLEGGQGPKQEIQQEGKSIPDLVFENKQLRSTIQELLESLATPTVQ